MEDKASTILCALKDIIALATPSENMEGDKKKREGGKLMEYMAMMSEKGEEEDDD